MKTAFLSAMACLIVCCLSFSSLAQDTRTDLAAVLQQAANRRQEYVDTFKDLTAVETQTTKIFDKNGKIEKQRTVISDLLIYQWQTDSDIVSEFRITREVDGKPVGTGEKQAIELFQKPAESKNSEQERKRLREESLKHTLTYYRWGITLRPVPAIWKAMQPAFVFSEIQPEQQGGRNMMVLPYQTRGMSRLTYELVRHFTNPETGERGRIWLDAEDFRVWRWESERTVVDRDITSAVVYMRDEIEYGTSPFGILVPKKIVTSFFDKSETNSQSLRLTGRITSTYDEFKRFEVKSNSEVPKLRNQ